MSIVINSKEKDLMSIRENIKTIRDQIKDNNVRLVAVSKGKTIEDIQTAYNDCNQRHFGENYLQELREKQVKVGMHVSFN